MRTLKQLETKQIGLRLPTYLVDDIAELTRDFNINRSTFITEAIQAFIKQQKEQRVYERLDEAMNDVKLMGEGKKPKSSARSLLDELDD